MISTFPVNTYPGTLDSANPNNNPFDDQGITAAPIITFDTSTANVTFNGTSSSHYDTMYISYVNSVVGVGNGRTGIFVSSATNADAAVTSLATGMQSITWSTAVEVDPSTGGTITQPVSAFLASLSVDPATGVVQVGWYDTRNDLIQQPAKNGITPPPPKITTDTDKIANTDVQYFIAYSLNGGSSFSTNQVLEPNLNLVDPTQASNINRSGDPNGFGLNLGVFAVGGSFYSAWADNSLIPSGTSLQSIETNRTVLMASTQVVTLNGTGNDTYYMELDPTGTFIRVLIRTPI